MEKLTGIKQIVGQMAEQQANSEEQPIIIKKIIKKGGHAAAHGGAWKVAYADFVTAMMCLFLLLWLINVDPSSKAAVSSFFKQPTQTGPMQGNVFIFGGAKTPAKPGKFEGGSSFLEFEKLTLTGQNKREMQQRMKKELKEQLEIGSEEELLEKVEFNLVDKGILIEIKDSDKLESFKAGSSALSESAKTLVDKIANVIRNKLCPIIVAGHTDTQHFNYGNYDNWNLSTDRAIAVKSRLAYSGVDNTRFARIEGYADTQPKDPELASAAANRRITILLLQEGELENLKPQYLDPDSDLGLDVKEEREEESAEKQEGDSLDVDAYHKSAGKIEKPKSLEELRRKKAREAYRAANPVKESAGGGHGEAPKEGGEAPAAKPSGGHGGGGHGGGH